MVTTHESSSRFSKLSQAIRLPQQQTQLSRSKQGTSTPILLLSSAAAGGVEALATYPFEYAKTLVQLQTVSSRHHNPFSVIWQVARHDGIATIYTGCSTLVAGTAFKVSIRFASYSHVRKRLADQSGIRQGPTGAATLEFDVQLARPPPLPADGHDARFAPPDHGHLPFPGRLLG